MVRPDQVEAILPSAAGGPGSGHGAKPALRRSGLLTGAKLKAAVAARAKTLGFDICRVAPADMPAKTGERLKDWVEAGHHGSMAWMEERVDERADPRSLWPGVRSVVMLGMNYGPQTDPLATLDERDRATISVYARGRDYHDVIKGRLKEIAGVLATRGGAEVKVFVDTAPVMEKALAQAAGLGWQGKHSVVVSRELGNWLFLGAIYTDADLPPDEAEVDHCGSCRRCLDACPTDAFPAPYVLDARRCISYLTIEHQGHIPIALRPAIGNRVFGCDDCLAVCPWNKFAQAGREAKLQARLDLNAPALAELAALDDAGFRARFTASPIKRTGRDRFLRNVLVAIGNSGSRRLADAARPHLDAPSPVVRAAAIWAMKRLVPTAEFAALARARAVTESDSEVRREWTD